MKLQVGDKLLCKRGCKNIPHDVVSTLGIKFIVGNYYSVFMNNEDVLLKDENGTLWWFNTDLSSMNRFQHHLWDFFCSPQEIRQLKLKELNRC